MRDGMNYAPKGRPNPVCGLGDFVFAVTGLDHGHIFGMCNGLMEAGAGLKWVYDPDPGKVAAFRAKYPLVQAAVSVEQILDDPEVRMVAAAAVPSQRAELGLKVLSHGKHYFTDKGPFTTLDQLERVRARIRETGRKYAVYYSERLHVESAVFAGQLIAEGAIGRVLQVTGLGPHRLNAVTRPAWFFVREQYGGILCDIGSHQVEQILHYTQALGGSVAASQVANHHHPDYPELEDFGDSLLALDNGASGYFRVDWFTPDGLGTWGDGRTVILGTEGYIELRKYIDVGRDPEGDQVYLVNGEGAFHIPVKGKVGYPFFGQLILDCLEGTERAMSQDHALLAAEMALVAQRDAKRIGVGTVE